MGSARTQSWRATKSFERRAKTAGAKLPVKVRFANS
jgi:hypothetical protein